MYGQPMDIEWALQESRVFIVQARPITALPQPPASPAEWALPDPKGTYVRSSVLELLPDPLSPLFATLGLHAFSEAMAAMLRSFGVEGFMTDRDVDRDQRVRILRPQLLAHAGGQGCGGHAPFSFPAADAATLGAHAGKTSVRTISPWSNAGTRRTWRRCRPRRCWTAYVRSRAKLPNITSPSRPEFCRPHI